MAKLNMIFFMENASNLFNFIISFIVIVISCVFVLIFIAFFTLAERKFMGLLQRREGPDKVGFEGILQPIADGAKLAKKEVIKPKDNMNPFLFSIAPMISFTVSISLWSLIPLNAYGAFSNPEISILLILGISSFGSYGVIYSGWASNNKYALMGSLRSVAQLISYEIIFSILFMPIIAVSRSFNLSKIVEYQEINGWFGWYLLPISFIFFVVALAETNRTPFDLPEAEAELVSGYNVEYSSLIFALFFLAEYSSMGIISALFVTCFWGGWSTNIFGNSNKFNYDSKFEIIENIRNYLTAFKNEKPDSFSINFYINKYSEIQASSFYFFKNIINDLDYIDKEGNSTKFAFLSDKIVRPESTTTKVYPGANIDIFDKTKKDNNFFTYNFNYDGNFRPYLRRDILKPNILDEVKNISDLSKKHSMLIDCSIVDYEKKIKNFIIDNYFYYNEFFYEYSPVSQSFISSTKIVFFCMIFIFVRAALPRKRFDQLIFLCWKYFFPFVLGFVIFVIGLIVYKIRIESERNLAENDAILKTIATAFSEREGYKGAYFHDKFYKNTFNKTIDMYPNIKKFIKIFIKASLFEEKELFYIKKILYNMFFLYILLNNFFKNLTLWCLS